MFDNLTARLSRTIEGLRGKGRITEENIGETLREARVALLEADVALPVVKGFIEAVKAKALGTEVLGSLTPGQAFIGILHHELIALMGGAGLRAQAAGRPAGGGAAGGPAGRRQDDHGREAGPPPHREGAQAGAAGEHRRAGDPRRCCSWSASPHRSGHSTTRPMPRTAPAKIARDALEAARTQVADVLIVDTAGRLHVDEGLMAEVREIDAAVNPAERLFVVDAMAGQDAINAARAFGAALDLTGIILTKADGDARGGAALSVRQVTGKPIVFLGVGEKTEALEPFDPARMASRILGMGDVVSLVEQVHRQVDTEEAQRLAHKVATGKNFNMTDLRGQLEQLQKMGGLGAVMDKLPGAMVKKGAISADQGDKELRRQIAIINSMTPRERRNPAIIDGSRRRRIAGGSGVQVQDVNRLLKQFMEMQRMMKSMKGGGLRRLMGAFKGGMPPGFPGR